MSRILQRCKWPFGPFAFNKLIVWPETWVHAGHVGPHVDASCFWNVPFHSLHPSSTFKSFRIMSCQFFRCLPGFLFMLLRFQFKAWFGTLQFSILITCPRHLSLLSLVISSSLAIHVFSDFNVAHFFTVFQTVVAEINGVLLPMSSYVPTV